MSSPTTPSGGNGGVPPSDAGSPTVSSPAVGSPGVVPAGTGGAPAAATPTVSVPAVSPPSFSGLADALPQGSEWTGQLTDLVENVVLTVKEKTTIPAMTAARAVIYGIVIAVLGIAVLVMLAIAGVRFLTVYLPVGHVHGHHRVWVSELLIGVVFTLGGLLCWSKRVGAST